MLWRGGQVSAVLDWDRLRVQGYAHELLRAATLTFGRDGTPDLTRIAAFAAGYRDAMPLTDDEITTAAQHYWWGRLHNLWPLDWHYDRGDTSGDHLYAPAWAVTRWWSDHREAVAAAFTGRR